jgi:serine/threonine protein kinase
MGGYVSLSFTLTHTHALTNPHFTLLLLLLLRLLLLSLYQLAGTASNGSVFGELSLIYGVPRQADVRAATSLICWLLDSLAFRRVQALIARDSLNTSKSKIMTKFGKEASALVEEQEVAVKDEIRIPFDDLEMISVVGQGTFGAVYIASSKHDPGTAYALKRMSKDSIVDRENEKRVLIERNALQAVRGCNHIITLMGTYQDADCIYFLTECVQGGNLISYMIDRDILTNSEACFYTYNVAVALEHIHSKGYIHRDVKPENCLIDKDGYIKLCDFGMAKRLPATVKMPKGGTEVVTLAFTMCGTPEFMAPEFVLSTGYDKAVDIWALGCIMVEMYSGRGPFDYDGDLKKTFKAVCLIGMGRKALDLPKQLMKPGIVDTAGDWARRCLISAKERIGNDDTKEVLNHKYFEMLSPNEIADRTFSAPYVPKVKNSRDASNFKQDGETPREDPIKKFTGDSSWSEGF